MFETSSDRFNMLRMITGQMSGYAMVFTASLGLFAVSSHLRNRNVKMVLTKPCLPETWIASIFLSAVLVAVVIYTLLALAAAALSWFWGIPWQWGFVFVALDGACRAVIQMAFLTCLPTAFHPVVAVLIALFFNEGIFYQLKYLIAGAIAADGGKPWLLAASVICDAFYLVMPMAEPLSNRTGVRLQLASGHRRRLAESGRRGRLQPSCSRRSCSWSPTTCCGANGSPRRRN